VRLGYGQIDEIGAERARIDGIRGPSPRLSRDCVTEDTDFAIGCANIYDMPTPCEREMESLVQTAHCGYVERSFAVIGTARASQQSAS